MTVVDKLRTAQQLLNEAAGEVRCGWCSSHISTVAVEVGDLVRIAEFAEQAEKDPRLLQTLRRVGAAADKLHLLTLLIQFCRSKLFRRITARR